jgi:magnesium transporter
MALLEALVELMADLIERVRGDLDGVSADIFSHHAPGVGAGRSAAELQKALQTMGRVNDRLLRIRDSLLVFIRITPYISQSTADWLPKELRPRLKTLRQDVASQRLRQSPDREAAIPPRRGAGVHHHQPEQHHQGDDGGRRDRRTPDADRQHLCMNFEDMPELHTVWGYPVALLAILASAVLPILWFRRRGWL